MTTTAFSLLVILIASVRAVEHKSKTLFARVDTRLGSNEWLLAGTVVQGLLNRAGSYVSINRNDADDMWFQESRTFGQVLQQKSIDDMTLEMLIETAILFNLVEGRVLYNRSETWALPTVLNLCTSHNAIPVHDEQWFSNLRTILDVRGTFKDELSATAFSVSAIGRHEFHGFSKKYLAIQTPSILSGGFLVDMLIHERMFVFFLTDSCTTNTSGAVLANEILNHKHWIRPVQVLGYFPTQEVVATCTSRHEQISVVSDWTPNLSFHSKLGERVHEYTQTPPQHVMYDQNKTYVAIINSDGDNLQLDINRLGKLFAERVKLCDRKSHNPAKCPPMSWTVSNRLLDFGRLILQYFFREGLKTERDSFLMGPSGWGFTHPTIMPSKLQAKLVKLTDSVANELHMEGYVHWDEYHSEPLMAAFISRFSKNGKIRGVFSPVQPNVPAYINGVETFVEWIRWFRGTSGSNIARKLKNAPQGALGFIYKIWEVDNAEVEHLANQLPPHVVLVGYRELISLARQKRALLGDQSRHEWRPPHTINSTIPYADSRYFVDTA